jgi:hypothetical protein
MEELKMNTDRFLCRAKQMTCTKCESKHIHPLSIPIENGVVYSCETCKDHWIEEFKELNMMNDIEASFIVCTKCKHIRHVDEYNTACHKRSRTVTTPEGVTQTYWTDTSIAIHKFRKENNGRCPYFEEKFTLSGFISVLLKRGEE